jgi:hypothetical protein
MVTDALDALELSDGQGEALTEVIEIDAREVHVS